MLRNLTNCKELSEEKRQHTEGKTNPALAFFVVRHLANENAECVEKAYGF